MKYFIKTFGCQQNHTDSQRIAASFHARKINPASSYKQANYVVINTCMIRQSAENRVYGLVNNLAKLKIEKREKNQFFKIIVTGCLVGLIIKNNNQSYLKKIKEQLSEVDEFLPIEEVGFDNEPVRQDKVNASVSISNGCNNYCTYCVVPYTRGTEISRPYEEIIAECQKLKSSGYENITLLGQNVNSYGSDLIKNSKKFIVNNREIKPISVKHLGRNRIPTLFPYLLEDVAKIGFKKVDFISSNPWDFSDELIEVIAKYKNITRTIHLPVQSGDNNVLKRMNRWYTCDDYLNLVKDLKSKVLNLKLTTDIIVGFCGETDEEFENTVKFCKKADFEKAYISMYSPRPFTMASEKLKDNIPYLLKKNRWQILENLINQPKLNILIDGINI